jgi:cytochrome c
MVKPVEAQTTQTAPKVEATTLTPEELGKKVYARCRTCHTLEEGGKNRVGPNLWMVFGKKAGTAEGYAYSKAIQASDITWDDASMDAYIENPKSFIPGNKMVFVGLRKEQDRQNLIAYLKANTGAE